jgi:hypothetical protein
LTEHWNGKTWTVGTSESPSGTDDYLFGVTAAGPKDFWAVGFTQVSSGPDITGDALVEESTGGAWTTQKEYSAGATTDTELYGVSAIGSKNIWAVGYIVQSPGNPNEPLIMHDDNGTWTETVPKDVGDGGTTELLSVDAVSPTDIWASGYTTSDDNTVIEAIMLHSTGGAFTRVVMGGTTSADTYSQLDSISAVSASDIWAVGYTDAETPLIEHYDGKDWNEVSSSLPSTDPLLGVTAVSPTNAWAIGQSYSATSSGQVIIHWDGKKWSRALSPTTKFAMVFGMSSVKSGYAVAVGSVDSDPYVEVFAPPDKTG